MFESDDKNYDFTFSETANVNYNRTILILLSEKYAPLLQRIRLKDKMDEWGYGVVTCIVSAYETSEIGKTQFDQLDNVAERIGNRLNPLNKSTGIALMAIDELAGLAIQLYLLKHSIWRIIMLNPSFCPGISSKLSRIEIPIHILFSGNAETTITASSRRYHDLISGSTIHSISGVNMEETFTKKTQFFSYLKSILVDDQQDS